MSQKFKIVGASTHIGYWKLVEKDAVWAYTYAHDWVSPHWNRFTSLCLTLRVLKTCKLHYWQPKVEIWASSFAKTSTQGFLWVAVSVAHVYVGWVSSLCFVSTWGTIANFFFISSDLLKMKFGDNTNEWMDTYIHIYRGNVRSLFCLVTLWWVFARYWKRSWR